jgi:hypothetical protein
MNGSDRRRLDEILGGDDLKRQWNETTTAEERGTLPAGTYRCLVTDGRLFESARNKTAGYKLTLEVLEPTEFAGRKLWWDIWLTAKALPFAKRELAKFRIHTAEQLNQAPPTGTIALLKVAVNTLDDQTAFNKIVACQVVQEGTPFAALAPIARSEQVDSWNGEPEEEIPF